MLTFLKHSKNINYVIVHSYEHFSRSCINGVSIANDLRKKHSIITLTVTQEHDLTTPSGAFQQNTMFLFGQMNNKLRRDKVVAEMKDLLMKSHWVWAAPRGYTDINKGKATERNLVVNDEGKILKKAFEWKAYKQTPNAKISRKLKTLGVDISEKRLHNQFTNPFYCGLILQLNNIRQENRVHGFVHDKDNENLPLKVFTNCEKCGTPMTGYLVKKKGIYYYKCRTNGCRVNKSAKSLHQMFQNLVSAFQIEKRGY